MEKLVEYKNSLLHLEKDIHHKMGHILDKDMKTDFKIMENNVRDLIEHVEKDF